MSMSLSVPSAAAQLASRFPECRPGSAHAVDGGLGDTTEPGSGPGAQGLELLICLLPLTSCATLASQVIFLGLVSE